jgi:hypothetical protein
MSGGAADCPPIATETGNCHGVCLPEAPRFLAQLNLLIADMPAFRYPFNLRAMDREARRRWLGSPPPLLPDFCSSSCGRSTARATISIFLLPGGRSRERRLLQGPASVAAIDRATWITCGLFGYDHRHWEYRVLIALTRRPKLLLQRGGYETNRLLCRRHLGWNL